MLFGTSQWVLVIRIASAAIAVNGVFVLMQDLLRWRLRSLWFIGASLSYAVFSIVFSIRLVVFEEYGLPGVFWGQIAGASAGAVVAFCGLRNSLSTRFSVVQLKAMLKYSLPLVLSSIAVFANQFVDRILVKELLGVADLGIYGVAARLASLMSLLSVGVQSALTPLIFRNQSHHELGVMVSKAFRFYCTFVILAIGLISLFSSEILYIFAGPAFYGARFIVPVLAVASVFSSLYMFSPGLFLAERTAVIASINVGCAALNIGLGVLLVQFFGTVGAAMAAMIAAVLAFTGFSYFGRRHFAIRLRPRFIFVSVLFAGLFVLGGAFWNTPAPRLDAMSVGLKLIALAVGSVVVIRFSLDGTDLESVVVWIKKLLSK
jgi:O-antigen/teichoic acid export membrane protein